MLPDNLEILLDGEFDALSSELARIDGLEQTLGGEMVEALKGALADADPDPDASPLAQLVSGAIQSILADGAVADMHGNIGMQMDTETVQRHGKPVLLALAGVMQEKLAEFSVEMSGVKLTTEPGAGTAAQSTEEGMKLNVDIMGMLREAMAQAAVQAAAVQANQTDEAQRAGAEPSVSAPPDDGD